MIIAWKQRLALAEEISCGAFVWKSDPVIAFLFQRQLFFNIGTTGAKCEW
jgi:hypothetical protein